MATIVDTIRDSMFEAIEKGEGLQKSVKSYIDEATLRAGKSKKDIADDIADTVSSFKTQAETRGKERKKINNVINDVSRICREELGYSIINKARKGGLYEYIAELPKLRATTKTSTHSSSPADTCIFVHFDASKHMVIPSDENSMNIAWDSIPVLSAYTTKERALRLAVFKFGGLEPLAKEILRMIKESKS